MPTHQRYVVGKKYLHREHRHHSAGTKADCINRRRKDYTERTFQNVYLVLKMEQYKQ